MDIGIFSSPRTVDAFLAAEFGTPDEQAATRELLRSLDG